MPKGNPDPVMPPKFVANRFKRSDETTEELAERNIQFRLTKSVDKVVRALPDRSAWLRRVVTEAAKLELMGDQED
ncbi:hypothetical protein [Acaryochloris sp. IP29b_bin.137]|uniref:hypothetical protein n=1 Tax=Acaryochloris sp. IP29b_bin.137 TaxID=2969217 RepID=UPI002608360A|nr:hypothetical protein [Acaryochloris sp. IP29b_bin.137]